MKRLLILLTLLNLLASCSHAVKSQPPTTPHSIDGQDSTLSKYVESFKQDAGMENSPNWENLHYGFVSRKTTEKVVEDAVGVCWRRRDGRREIVVAKEYWDEIGPAQRAVLIYHELAHCVCDMPHGHMNGTYVDNMSGNKKDEGFFKDGCPSSLMYPNVISDECAKQHWPQYVKEIKLRCENLQLDDLFPLLEHSCG